MSDEGMRGKPERPLAAGELVRLRDNLPQGVVGAMKGILEPGAVYKVYAIEDREAEDEGTAVAYIGPVVGPAEEAIIMGELKAGRIPPGVAAIQPRHLQRSIR